MGNETIKVLIIDDEPLVRRSLSRAFELSQMQVFEAENGIQGLDLWRSKAPDLVLLDVLMPGLSGFEVLKKVDKDLRDRTKVILMSAFSGKLQWEGPQTESVDLLLSKPFEDIFKVVTMAEELMKK